MKKTLLSLGLLLAALATMAPGPPEKAEKLRYDDNNWDIQPFYSSPNGEHVYGVSIEGVQVKYGLATAGEHADFTVGIRLSGVRIDSNGWDNTWSEHLFAGFRKDPNAAKDADGYIAVLTDPVSWNGDDDGGGYVVDEVALSLVGPGGQSVGETSTVPTGWVLIDGPGFQVPLMIDDEGWDYLSEQNAIVVPLLARAELVDELEKQGYQVTVTVEVWNVDGTFAGAGRGSAEITRANPGDWGYVPIEPVLATVTSPEWNGDDDGSGIVSGMVDLVDPAGDVIISVPFEQVTVGFILPESPCGDCAPGETLP